MVSHVLSNTGDVFSKVTQYKNNSRTEYKLDNDILVYCCCADTVSLFLLYFTVYHGIDNPHPQPGRLINCIRSIQHTKHCEFG